MTSFVRDLVAKGEDPASIIILLETEWPKMEGKVGKEWVVGIEKWKGV